MIEIKKEQEPSELITHRKTAYATYENMPVETHQAVLNSLMHEQGFLCAYCMRRIPQKGRIPSATIELRGHQTVLRKAAERISGEFPQNALCRYFNTLAGKALLST